MALVYYPNSSTLFSTGACWQCTKCYTVYATQYEPLIDNKIGYWCSHGWSEPISAYGAVIVTNSMLHTTGTKILGVKLRY